jgi:serine/threonine-protein kinase
LSRPDATLFRNRDMIDAGSQVGDYEVLATLGAGGVGRIYKARHRLTGRTEALKVLLPARSLDQESRERFLREVQVQANLQHPNIASVLTAFESEYGLVLVMEFVEGESLGEYLERGRLPLEEQLSLATQALSGLAYAHSRGVIHRDIKPENLLIGPSKTLKITDFGLAKTVTDVRLTATGTPMGSVYYLSPEQVMKGDAVDHRADIYSMGAVLYQLATGRRPFRGAQAYELMRAHLEELPTPPVELDASIPTAYSRVILKAMSKDPAERFASADEFSSELRVALRKSAAAATPPAAAAPAPAPRARFGDRRALGLVAALALVAGAAVFAASWLSSPAPVVQTAPEKKSPASVPALPDLAAVETPPSAAPSAGPKPSPVQSLEADAPALETPATSPAIAVPPLPATVQVRILNPFGSDSAGEISGEIIGPAELAGYRVDGEVIEAKSSGKEDKQSDLKIVFTRLQSAGETVTVEAKIEGFRNSRGDFGVDENGKELKLKGGVLKRGREAASNIGSAVGGLLGRRGNRDRSPSAATLTARAARISFSPGSEFDLYLSELESR